MYRLIAQLIFIVSICYGQSDPKNATTLELHNAFSERVGNFSVELLYQTAKFESDKNLVISPFTTWTTLAVIGEGASGETLNEIRHAIRLPKRHNNTRTEFQKIAQWLLVNTSTVTLERFNGLFIDTSKILERDFRSVAKKYYDTEVIPLNFTDSEKTANIINQGISRITHGKIPKLVESSSFGQTQMILTSALYFKGQWTAPFNASQTMKTPFYDANGKNMGEVNMMYNRYTYPFANIKGLQARVIELPYGKENRLSMLIMLPNPGVTLEDMFLNFKTTPLDTVFKELKLAQEEYGEDEVDCFIPRFKIESDLVLNDVLQNFGIYDLFDLSKANLPFVARTPLYVTRVIHKAEIEVTEEGTVAAGVTAAEFANRIGIVRFEANRPFSYLIIEKVTNSIVFGGVYRKPSLY